MAVAASEPCLSSQATVGSLAASLPGAAAVFERLGIDYCCAGKVRLEQACKARGLDTGDVLGQLTRGTASPTALANDWGKAGLTELADHIEQTHHRYLKTELPRLRTLAEKVARARGARQPSLRSLWDEFERFAADMADHMDKEEKVLFPLLRALEQGRSRSMPFPIDRPIRCMMEEHADAGRSLEMFRRLTDDYRAPEGACTSWRVLLADLGRLEQDMHQHVHKENNILFPRAIAAAATV